MDFSRARRKAAWPSICDGDSTRYPGSAYCWICESERAFFLRANLGGTARVCFFKLLSHGFSWDGSFLFLSTYIFFI